MIKHELMYKKAKIEVLSDDMECDKPIEELIRYYDIVERYAAENREFTGLKPVDIDSEEPIIKEMCEASKKADVGPMAAVAGSIAEHVCRNSVKESMIVNNGGDIFMITSRPIVIGLFAGFNNIADKLAVRVKAEETPLAICSSSSKLGHSLSYGDCDLVTVFSKKGAIADAVATAVCNNIKEEKDIEKTLNEFADIEGVLGIIAVRNDKIGIIGSVPEIIRNKDLLLRDKVIKEDFYQL